MLNNEDSYERPHAKLPGVSVMQIKSDVAKVIISFVLMIMPAMAHSKGSNKNTHRKPAHAVHKRHYLLHHDHHHINDPKHPRSPKWHPTNPHSGNFAD